MGKLYLDLTIGSHETSNFIMDNECSFELQRALKKYKLKYQLVPPHVHRRNAAERAVRTFKNHFLSVLATCDKSFPIHEWDRLLPQTLLTLNLLRSSRSNPNLSSYAYLYGNFDFNKTPLAPAGTKAVIHTKPENRRSWDYHGVDGWYIGPSLLHYRCLKCFVTATRAEIDADTVQLIEHDIPIPAARSNDHILYSIQSILDIINDTSTTSIIHNDILTNSVIMISNLLKNNIIKNNHNKQPSQIRKPHAAFPRVQKTLRHVVPPPRVETW